MNDSDPTSGLGVKTEKRKVKSGKLILLLLLLFFWSVGLHAQLIPDARLHRLSAEALENVYAWNFKEARQQAAYIGQQYPGHPAAPFLMALVSYWEGRPLPAEGPEVARFEELLRQTGEQAARRLEANPEQPDMLFFQLMSKAVLMRHYAAVGQKMKAVGEAKETYQLVKQGFELADRYPDFRFSTGLYHFYREVYPEQHPIYKPFMMFFPSGDRQKGIRLITEASVLSVFSKVESALYLVYIYTEYEKQPARALQYAFRLHEQYPKNPHFALLLAHTAYIAGQQERTLATATPLLGASDAYYRFVAHTLEGLVWLDRKKSEQALAKLQAAERLIPEIANRSTYFWVYLYGGLWKYHELYGSPEKAREYHRLAKKYDHNQYLKKISL